MIDAFGNELSIGDEVICIATLRTGNATLYRGKIDSFAGSCINVTVMKLSCYDDPFHDQPDVGSDKRVCMSHRIYKI